MNSSKSCLSITMNRVSRRQNLNETHSSFDNATVCTTRLFKEKAEADIENLKTLNIENLKTSLKSSTISSLHIHRKVSNLNEFACNETFLSRRLTNTQAGFSLTIALRWERLLRTTYTWMLLLLPTLRAVTVRISALSILDEKGFNYLTIYFVFGNLTGRKLETKL